MDGNHQSTEQVLLTMSNPFGYAPADSEVGSKYGNTSGTHMETIYPVTEKRDPHSYARGVEGRACGKLWCSASVTCSVHDCGVRASPPYCFDS